jgi:hypothetical protein
MAALEPSWRLVVPSGAACPTCTAWSSLPCCFALLPAAPELPRHTCGGGGRHLRPQRVMADDLDLLPGYLSFRGQHIPQHACCAVGWPPQRSGECRCDLPTKEHGEQAQKTEQAGKQGGKQTKPRCWEVFQQLVKRWHAAHSEHVLQAGVVVASSQAPASQPSWHRTNITAQDAVLYLRPYLGPLY